MVKGTPDYKGIVKRVMRSDIYLEAMKDMGVSTKIAEEQKATLFDSTLDAADPEKYATSFPIHSLA
jgi:nitrate/nitrite transport system substrate-binding protein